MKPKILNAFGIFEDIIYGILAVLLIGVAGLVIFSIFNGFVHTIGTGELETGIIHIIDNILLGLMVAEILYTVVISFESHSLKPEPFLIVGLIASVRRILLISLEAAHVTKLDPAVFRNFMLELGILSVLILIFVVSIYILRKKVGE